MSQDHSPFRPQTSLLYALSSQHRHWLSHAASIPHVIFSSPSPQSAAKFCESCFLQFLLWHCPLFRLSISSPWQYPHLPPSMCHNAARYLTDLWTNLNMSLVYIRILICSPLPIVMIFKLLFNNIPLFNQYFLEAWPIKQNQMLWKPCPFYLPTNHALTSTRHFRGDSGI